MCIEKSYLFCLCIIASKNTLITNSIQYSALFTQLTNMPYYLQKKRKEKTAKKLKYAQ